jgi:hypothetical protein
MSRGSDLLPIEVVVDDTPVTSHAGLLPYLDLWRRLSMPTFVDQQVSICGKQGWTDRQMVLSLVLLNLAGGDCITDIDGLESDAGLCEMIRGFERSTWNRRDLRSVDSRFRSGRSRTFPAATQIASFLESCHDEASESMRVVGKAFIPAATEGLASLRSLNTALVSRLQTCAPQSTATLDGDATLVETHTKTALFSYEGYRAYQPYNVWWSEQKVVLHSEFRDGNVPAGHEVTRAMKDALSCLPSGVTKVYTRQDTAAYQTEFLAWCEREREHDRYGRILFTVSADISRELRAAIEKATDWQPQMRVVKGRMQPTGREYAEVVFVPMAQALLSDITEPFRYIAIRERLGSQLSLLEGEDADVAGDATPFPSLTIDRVRYKVHAIVTNRRDEDASELIRWHYERCGKSEEAHAVMKNDFAGGQLPSAKFGANAAWWALTILSMNLQRILSGLMGDGWTKKRMKAVRFALINTPGRLAWHARQFFLRVPEVVGRMIDSLRASIAALDPVWT